jgi:hypothetical protein
MEKKIFSLLTFLFLFASSTFAQDFLTSILPQFVGVIFILIFILILLAIGGVFPKPKGGLPLGLIAFLILIVLLFVIPQFIPFPQYLEVPESFKYQSLPEAAKDALQLIGLPREWGYVPAIIYLFILPFAAIYTLVWAFLVALGIFPQANVNRILALIIAFMTIPMGWFVKIVWILFSFMGAWSVAVFAATFVLGIFFRGAGAVAKQHQEYKKLVDIRKERLRDAIKSLESFQNADLQTIKNQLPAVLQRFVDILPATSGALLNQAISEADKSKAQAYIKQAVNELKNQL